MLVTYLRAADPADAGAPDGVRRGAGARTPRRCWPRSSRCPGRAVAVEVDLLDDGAAGGVFDAAERRLGPVSILVNNASGWVADTFAPDAPTASAAARAVTPATSTATSASTPGPRRC